MSSLTEEMMTVLATVGDALGCDRAPGTTECGVCGNSPFSVFGPLHKSLGPMFSRWPELRNPAAANVCSGCKAILGGRPGRTPPPLRMMSFRVQCEDPVLQPITDRDEWWRLLAGPPDDPTVVSWAQSRKKHHVLNAGISADGRWRIGSDEELVAWEHDAGLQPAVSALLALGVPKGAIVSGRYPARLIARAAAKISALESVVFRYRGPVLDLFVWAAPAASKKPLSKEELMLPPEDKLAVNLIATLAFGSTLRTNDGLRFWGGFLLSRMRRFMRLPLPDLVSRLASECGCAAGSVAAAGRMVETMDADTENLVSRAIRSRTDLVHALALDDMARRRKPQENNT